MQLHLAASPRFVNADGCASALAARDAALLAWLGLEGGRRRVSAWPPCYGPTANPIPRATRCASASPRGNSGRHWSSAPGHWPSPRGVTHDLDDSGGVLGDSMDDFSAELLGGEYFQTASHQAETFTDGLIGHSGMNPPQDSALPDPRSPLPLQPGHTHCRTIPDPPLAGPALPIRPTETTETERKINPDAGPVRGTRARGAAQGSALGLCAQRIFCQLRPPSRPLRGGDRTGSVANCRAIKIPAAVVGQGLSHALGRCEALSSLNSSSGVRHRMVSQSARRRFQVVDAHCVACTSLFRIIVASVHTRGSARTDLSRCSGWGRNLGLTPMVQAPRKSLQQSKNARPVR